MKKILNLLTLKMMKSYKVVEEFEKIVAEE